MHIPSLQTITSILIRFFESPDKRFIREWSIALSNHAKVFNGLFASLDKVSQGTAKNPSKVLKEWNDRSRYNLKDIPCVALMAERMKKYEQSPHPEMLKKLADLLLTAAIQAGIIKEKASSLTLNESNVNAYTDWDGEELYVDDSVEIMSPAWYQNGIIIEKGYCKHS